MSKFFVRLAINAVALWAASELVSGISLSGGLLEVLIVAFIFGLVNALIKPILNLVTLPIRILTLGLFTLVINALMLLLTATLSNFLTVSGFWPAVIGSIVVSLVSLVLSMFVDDD